ncbi:hypothetical protein DVH24_013302 [Malus domestica]|uniref:Uncharacterized protein n=1 Tax=Malus domestica TaxID=3750 RepID=A0A498HGG3_MALDO|nr:hypothetical protein DVH24_013302 [Malus domestica]
MEERHKIQVFQRELPFCLELVTQLPKPKGNGRRSKLKAIVMEMKRNGVLFSLSKGKKALERQMDRSTTDTVSGDSGGNNKKEEKDGQGNKGENGHQSCTAGSCMLFSSTTKWFTWYAIEINLVGYVILYDWMNN